MKNFGDIAPYQGRDILYLSLFDLELPSNILVADARCSSAKTLFAKNPRLSFYPFELRDRKIFTFHKLNETNPLSKFVSLDKVTATELSDFTKNENNQNVVKIIVNRWIKRRCRKNHLNFDDRTKAHYYPRTNYGEGIVTAKWKPKAKTSVRELTRPMKKNGITNFWVHRATSASCINFCGKFYIQIRPRFLFSSDGFNLYDGTKSSRFDRYFRKSKFNRNLNQLYDVRFWAQRIFPEIENPGVVRLTKYLGYDPIEPIKILEQVSLESKWKPSIETEEEVEELDKIDSDLLEYSKMDEFFEE